MLRTIYVKTTDTCNLNCSHCFTNGINGEKTNWDWKGTQQWISSYLKENNNHTLHIELHGGEPFLVPLDIIKSFTRPFEDNELISIGATTNLVYKLSEELIDFIKKVLRKNIATSWDKSIRFANQRQYDLWRSNIRTLKERNVPVKINISITSDLVNSPVETFIEEMNAIQPEIIALERLTRSGSAVNNLSIFPDNEKQDLWYLDLLKSYENGLCQFKIQDFDILKERLSTNLTKVYHNCRDCEQKLLTISSNGQLATCPNAALENHFSTINDHHEVFLNHEGRIKEISKELDFHEGCISCEVFEYCGGDCHRLNWDGKRCGGLKHTLSYLLHSKSFEKVNRYPVFKLEKL